MSDDLETWPEALADALGSTGPLERITVLRETDSTQDAARRMNARPGDVVIAGRQTRGRGRLGRPWFDDDAQGVALSAVVERDESSQRLAIASAVGAAIAAEAILKRRVGIKWPNDIIVDGRKLAGILIEQDESRAIIGIGMNVGQREWPEELHGVAVSMAELGVTISRLEALRTLLGELNRALRRPQQELIAAYLERDVLRGTVATFRNGDRSVTGLVTALDPVEGLRVRSDDDGEEWLPAATTSIVKTFAATPAANAPRGSRGR